MKPALHYLCVLAFALFLSSFAFAELSAEIQGVSFWQQDSAGTLQDVGRAVDSSKDLQVKVVVRNPGSSDFQGRIDFEVKSQSGFSGSRTVSVAANLQEEILINNFATSNQLGGLQQAKPYTVVVSLFDTFISPEKYVQSSEASFAIKRQQASVPEMPWAFVFIALAFALLVFKLSEARSKDNL
ncbi:MAG TPA: hypothetical protein HA222_00285 [Candidatus Diapherotrites archaeon]|uniref:CARDB domain-containing protein n=1 Tax=Candidatus Iainarchaeum sp. TaxID=3101447 RepID=A0A7J4KWF1_9ARCH|nr:hypothetical protein [Candidatus Diapherotrites archaeon]HIH33439.1 hypothetical protein [Candidatus Diapherotrites archaeon]